MQRLMRTFAIAIALALSLTSTSALVGAEQQEGLIVTCARPCAAVAAAVDAAGGSIVQRYDNVDAVAVVVPAGRVADLAASFGAGSVRKDMIVNLPPPREPIEVEGVQSVDVVADAAAADFAQSLPANYNFNNSLTGAASLHAQNLRGQDVIVGVIDTGTAVADSALSGTVIGGENFVTTDPVQSAISRRNDWHGSAVGTMIAAHANFLFANTSTLVAALNLYAPDSVFACGGAVFPGCPAGLSVVPMFGTAPAARIYALKVFHSQGGGAPESRIIAAMDRAITLRRNFNNGVPSVPRPGTGTGEDNPAVFDSLNIGVVNMSLGGPTLNAGRDIGDQLTLEMVKVGITIVASAGNDGFAAMTGGSPGTGIGTLTVAASSTPVHERVLRDLQFAPVFGTGIGALFRPFSGVQTAFFSSRGPTADGRFDPEISANGFASYVNVFAARVTGRIVSCGHPLAPATGPNRCLERILFVSGTSFSSPTTAGAAALLRAAVTEATALQTRNALIRGANPTVVADGSGRIDQGEGFLDVPAALALLRQGEVTDDEGARHERDDEDDNDDDEADEVGAGGRSVERNLRELGIRPIHFVKNRFTTPVSDLLPGQVANFFVPSDIFTNTLVVKLSDITRQGSENQLFGDDLFVMAVDAPTSFAVHRIFDSGGSEGAFVTGDTTFTIDHPQTGLVRVAIQGDWTNNSRISARLTIERVRRVPPLPSAVGRIRQNDLIPFSIDVPAGAGQAVFELFWQQNWGRYPTNDLDMFVIDPNGQEFLDAFGRSPGATLNSPERVVVISPLAGTWTVLVNGFTIQGKKDVFTLAATADGQRLKITK